MEKISHPLNKLIYDLSSDGYHSAKGTYSSSQFKDLLDDSVMFYKKYISKVIPRTESEAFDLGTFVHTGVLEPDKLKSECVMYPGKIRRGEKWESFKSKHKGKAILTSIQYKKGLELIKCVQASETAMEIIDNGDAEVSLFVELLVINQRIYCKGYVLDDNLGWVPATKAVGSGKATRIVIKVRADSLGMLHILDLKTTTGNARSERSVRDAISRYNYDLSASLYLDIFAVATENFSRKFYWTFVSKDYLNCRTYVAHQDNILVGRAKWKKAILELVKGIRTSWTVDDSIVELRPNFYEYEHIKKPESYSDLL